MPGVIKDSALAEITLRRYEKPFKMSSRDLVKKLCLSLGLLQEGDSRDCIVDILQIFLEAKKAKTLLNIETINNDVIKLRKNARLPLIGIAASNIRRQLKKLREIHLVEKINEGYRISEFESLATLFEERTEKIYIRSISDRVKDYIKAVEQL